MQFENFKRKNSHFSLEEDLFLSILCQNFPSKKDTQFWKILKKIYNNRFQFSKKTIYQLKSHIENCHQKELKKGIFSKEEEKNFKT
jgi:hypothetical protein